ncbi:MAG: hypothetical protein ACPGVB_03345 [Chitinophagales bacterium]
MKTLATVGLKWTPYPSPHFKPNKIPPNPKILVPLPLPLQTSTSPADVGEFSASLETPCQQLKTLATVELNELHIPSPLQTQQNSSESQNSCCPFLRFKVWRRFGKTSLHRAAILKAFSLQIKTAPSF